jgi:trigger factor
MKVLEKKLQNGLIRLEVTVTPEEVNKVLYQCKVAFAQQMGMQPAKQGQTVDQAAEEQMGIKNLDSIVEPNAIETFVPMALDKKNLVPAFPPKAQSKVALRRNTEYKFTADVTPKPEYELESYEPVAFDAPAFKLDEALVDEQIKQMAGNYTSYIKDESVPADKTVAKGDSVLIAIKAFEGDKELKNLNTEGRTYTAGQGYMPEGFENEVLGMKAGETKTFTFDGPSFDEDFNETTQTVTATVTVIEFQHEDIPEITDEWVKTNMPMYKGVEQLRNDIRRSLERQSRESYDAYVMQLAAAELAKRFKGNKIPDEIYESTRDSLVQNIRADLQQQGKSWDDFVKENGGEQQFGMMLMLQTRETLVQGFSLDALFRHEKMTLTQDDLLATCHAMNPQGNPKQMLKQVEDAGRGFALRESAQRMKANRWLVDHAKINYVS